MAIHPKLHPHSPHQANLTTQQAHAISSWTEQATESLESLSISGTHENSTAGGAANVTPRQTSAPLLIPIDDEQLPNAGVAARVRPATKVETQRVIPSAYGRRETLHRDSLKRRDALLKGKEGSRRRQRWENGSCFSFLPLGRTPQIFWKFNNFYVLSGAKLTVFYSRSAHQQSLGTSSVCQRLADSAILPSSWHGSLLPGSSLGCALCA